MMIQTPTLVKWIHSCSIGCIEFRCSEKYRFVNLRCLRSLGKTMQHANDLLKLALETIVHKCNL